MALLTHNRRIGSLCRRHCYDLSIAEMLSDTIVQALMEADGIEPEILAAQLRGIARQISAARREDKTPFQGGGGGGGSFLDRHEPPNHRHGGSGGGSRNDGNASKPVVPNDQNDVLATIGAAMQQVKKAEGER